MEKKLDINTKDAIQIIVDDIRSYLDGIYRDWEIGSWSEMLDAFGQTSADFKEDVRYTLIQYYNRMGCVYFPVTDDCEIVNTDGSITTYRQLTNLVRKELGW